MGTSKSASPPNSSRTHIFPRVGSELGPRDFDPDYRGIALWLPQYGGATPCVVGCWVTALDGVWRCESSICWSPAVTGTLLLSCPAQAGQEIGGRQYQHAPGQYSAWAPDILMCDLHVTRPHIRSWSVCFFRRLDPIFRPACSTNHQLSVAWQRLSIVGARGDTRVQKPATSLAYGTTCGQMWM